MSLPRYESYKDSGVEWLGEVPKHWDIYEGKRIFGNRRELALSDDDQLAASQKYGVIPQTLMMELNASKVMLALKGTESFRHVEKNDFVISLRSFEGGIEHSKYVGCVSPAYTVLRSSKKVVPVFFRYLFKSGAFISAIQTTTDSLRDGKSITYQQFGSISLPIPTSHEQSIIANFLDHETAKIDNLIAEQQQLIKLLKEKRQAVISHAVTKGLNPDVPMKDSGVEWLGEVPEHWEISKLKHVVSIPVTDGPHETPNFPNDGIPFVSAEAVSSGKIDFSKIRGFISEDDHVKYSQKYCPKKWDIFMIKSGATTGITAIVETDTVFNIWSPLAVIRCGNKAEPYYILNFLRSKNFQEAVALNWSFGTQQNIGMGVIENLKVLLPPNVEQQSIAIFLNQETAKIDNLIAESTNLISLSKERRSALISSAVTGKIDVRNFVPSQPQVEAMA